MVSLQWDNIEYAVGDKEILRGISGKVNAGGTLAILGPSGCGKTSLLNVLSGMIKGANANRGGSGGKVRLGGTITLGGAKGKGARMTDVGWFVSQFWRQEISNTGSRYWRFLVANHG